MRIQSEYLREFGLSMTWAMCKNPMCEHFGIGFEGATQTRKTEDSDPRYAVRRKLDRQGGSRAEIVCRACGQGSRLISNRAIRPIARFFLGLSLPFADCPNEACDNHGVNLYEHWPIHGDPDPVYRRTGAHTARCNRCRTDDVPHGASIVLGTPRKAADRPQTPARWRSLLDALPGAYSIADTTERLGISRATYHRDLARLGARLNDYHAFRNAHLLRPDTPDRPVSVSTGLVQLSARLTGPHGSAGRLPVIVTVASAGGANFVLAAHPCFLPGALAPDAATLDADFQRRPPAREWGALAHRFGDGPGRKESLLAEPGSDGIPIRVPYAALAHFLVVQKLLSRFRAIHLTLDAEDGLAPAALVAWRDRILAGRPGVPTAESGELPRTVEVVLFDYDRRQGRLKTVPTGRPPAVPDKAPDDAWRAAEERFAEQPVPPHLEAGRSGRDQPRILATVYRQAFKGACTKTGGWAWLHHSSRIRGYPDARTLWLTRTPHKTYKRHGRSLLTNASLRPLDAVFSAIRANVRSARRPLTRALRPRRGASRPAVVSSELAIYLLLRNYGLSTTPRPPDALVPAEAMGLANDDREDPADIAWRFRLGIRHARMISRWLRG